MLPFKNQSVDYFVSGKFTSVNQRLFESIEEIGLTVRSKEVNPCHEVNASDIHAVFWSH